MALRDVRSESSVSELCTLSLEERPLSLVDGITGDNQDVCQLTIGA